MTNKKIIITKNGPYLVPKEFPLSREKIVINEEGSPEKWQETEKIKTSGDYALCRCGHSSKKPFCDGAHAKVNFNGKETAKNEPYEKNVRIIEGTELILKDKQEFCASARFCDKCAGTWALTEDSADPDSKKMAIETACNCPSGRLVCCNKKTNNEIEPNFEKSLVLVEDPQKKVSGPIWVKGKIAVVSSEGKEYEVRNRVTLCRCGTSENKPFCDGSHIPAGFKDKPKG